MTDAFDDLIARLEKASGPSHKLDRDIEKFLQRGVFTDVSGMEEGDALAIIHHSPGRGSPFPRYTASIDAALTLVPDWHKWSVACGRLVQYVARVTPTKSHHGFSDGECDSTPAIALCIAALKARKATASPPMTVSPATREISHDLPPRTIR